MPTIEETKELFSGLREALIKGRSELNAVISSLRNMSYALDRLDTLNGNILAARNEAALMKALQEARQGVLDVNGYVKTRVEPVYDENGASVLDAEGNPVTEEVTTIVAGFLDVALGYDKVDAQGNPVLDDQGVQVRVPGLVGRLQALETETIEGIDLRTALAMAVAIIDPQ